MPTRITSTLLICLVLLAGCGEPQTPAETTTTKPAEPGPLAKALKEKAEASAGMIPEDVMALMQKAGKELQASGLADQAKNVGQDATDFELKDPFGRPVSLAALREKGPVVVAFYRGKW